MTAHKPPATDVPLVHTVAALRREIGPPWADRAKEREAQPMISVAELRQILDALEAVHSRPMTVTPGESWLAAHDEVLRKRAIDVARHAFERGWEAAEAYRTGGQL